MGQSNRHKYNALNILSARALSALGCAKCGNLSLKILRDNLRGKILTFSHHCPPRNVIISEVNELSHVSLPQSCFVFLRHLVVSCFLMTESNDYVPTWYSLVYQDDQGPSRQEYQLFKVRFCNNKINSLPQTANQYLVPSVKIPLR